MHMDIVNFDLHSVPNELLEALSLTSGVVHPVRCYLPVLALTLTRGVDHDAEVLVCVRDGLENDTHPNVLSSPTRRLRGLELEVETLGGWSLSDDAVCPDWLLTEVRALLAEKLSMAAPEVANVQGGRVQVWQGESVIGTRRDGTIAREPLTMLNVHVALSPDTVIASRSTSYTSIAFVPLSQHRQIFLARDCSRLFPSYQEADIPLVYGLCTASTSSMIARVFDEHDSKARGELAALV